MRAIYNARILTPEGKMSGCVSYDEESGKILSLSEKIPEGIGEDSLYDAKNAWLLPGGIDPHVHLGGFGEISIADDFYSGSLGALAGGTTTVIDFCEPEKGETAVHCIEKRMAEAESSCVDYCFHFVMTREYERQFRELPDVKSYGISDFKLFTVYDNTDLTAEEIRHVTDRLCAEFENPGDLTFLVHSEDREMIEELRRKASDETDMRMLAWTRPGSAEAAAVREIMEIAKDSPAAFCIAHVSAAETMALLAEQKRAGEPSVKFETCPHYLTFTEEKLAGPDGALYTMTPPLRNDASREALWEGIQDGGISMFSTDHCPYRSGDKRGKTYRTVPCGVDGIQTRFLYLYSEGVRKRGLSMEQLVKLTSENAARFYHLFPRKGCIAPGSDADLVLLDENGCTEISRENRRSNLDYTIYEGMTLQGKINLVVKGGRTVYRDGVLTAERGMGRYLKK